MAAAEKQQRRRDEHDERRAATPLLDRPRRLERWSHEMRLPNAGRTHYAPGVTSLGTLGQISRTVSDIARSEEWYRSVLGLKHLYTYGPLAFFDLGGTRLMLSAEGGSNATESVLYFRVADIHSAHDELAARGALFKGPPRLIHRHEDGMEEWMAFFEDPDGRLLALMSQTT